MFKVKIYVDSDGDFSYKEPLFDLHDTLKSFYFEDRTTAVNAIIQSFHNLRNNLYIDNPSLNEIKEWVEKTDDKIELIVKKFKTFEIEKDFGNQCINYSIAEFEMQNEKCGGYCYKKIPNLNFLLYTNPDDILWDKIDELPDV